MEAPQPGAQSYLIDRKYRRISCKERVLRRLFSSFARGWPGAGLLLVRAVVAISLIAQAVSRWQSGGPMETAVVAAIAAADGVLVLGGLWTPIGAALAVIIEVWKAYSQPGDPWIYILLACISAALALLGPGGYSVDARIFGWKRIDIGERQG